mgnify:CR=1 FL=1
MSLRTKGTVRRQIRVTHVAVHVDVGPHFAIYTIQYKASAMAYTNNNEGLDRFTESVLIQLTKSLPNTCKVISLIAKIKQNHTY